MAETNSDSKSDLSSPKSCDSPHHRAAELLVLRFWWAEDDKTLLDKESLLAAQSWSTHRQLVYTNVLEMVWREAGIVDYEIVPYEPPTCSHNYDISLQWPGRAPDLFGQY